METIETLTEALKGKKTYLLVAAYVLFVGFTGLGEDALDLDAIGKMMTAGMIATLRAGIAAGMGD